MFIKAVVDMSEERALCQEKETVEDAVINARFAVIDGVVIDTVTKQIVVGFKGGKAIYCSMDSSIVNPMDNNS